MKGENVSCTTTVVGDEFKTRYMWHLIEKEAKQAFEIANQDLTCEEIIDLNKQGIERINTLFNLVEKTTYTKELIVSEDNEPNITNCGLDSQAT